VQVLFLDDDGDLRDAMAVVMRDLGHEVLVVGSLSDLKAMAPAALRSALAILDLNLGAGQPSGVDAYRWLCSCGFGGRVVFLTGHGRSFPLVQEAATLQASSIRHLEKPITIEQLESLVAEVAS
jgi:FixJ family two-component response regulator